MYIGIIEHPDIHKEVIYPVNYVKWIESSGATAVPIPYNVSKTTLRNYLDRLDAMIWTGGYIESHKYSEKQYMTYMKTLKYCFDTICDFNDNGRSFPIWGTCLGFEILVLLGKKTPLPTFFNHLQSHPCNGKKTITFTSSPSTMKQWFSPSMRKKMASTLCSTHHHTLGFDIQEFDYLTVVSTQDGFVNMIEYKKYPFYGVQFHPERPFDAFSLKVSKELCSLFQSFI